MAKIPVNRRRRALLSVTDKSQLEDIASLLHSFDYELIASGGTARFLREHRFPVTDVSEVTGFPEIFGGRVKTLHPAIHGGILGPSLDDFTDVVDPPITPIAPIDLVIVNLYRFAAAQARGADESEAIEQIDIGGPTLLRSAAKNFRRVTVVSGIDQYEELLHELRFNNGDPSLETRPSRGGSKPNSVSHLPTPSFYATAKIPTKVRRCCCQPPRPTRRLWPRSD